MQLLAFIRDARETGDRQMAQLREFVYPDTHEQIFRSNLEYVNRLSEDDSFRSLVAVISDQLGMEESKLKAVCQRHLITAAGTNPNYFGHRPTISWLLFSGWLIIAVVRSFAASRHSAKASLLFGQWKSGRPDQYEALFSEARKRAISCREVLREEPPVIGMGRAVGLLPAIARMFKSARRFRRDEGINFHWAVIEMLREYVIGLYWRHKYQAKVLISALDNADWSIRANAAGAALILVQNGYRGNEPGSCFIVADQYAALGPAGYRGCLLTETGVFEWFQAGSLALARFALEHPDWRSSRPSPEGRVLWVSDFDDPLRNREAEAERVMFADDVLRSLATVLAYAKQTNNHVDLFPRDERDVAWLKAQGLDLTDVKIWDRDLSTVYEAVSHASVVLSCVSTVVSEAMMMRIPAGYVCLAPNAHNHVWARQAGLVYDGSDGSLESFVKELERGVRGPSRNAPFIVAPEETAGLILYRACEAIEEDVASKVA